MNLENFRREYLKGGLDRDQLADSPMDQFELWMGQALATDILDPTAMVLATVDSSGQPSQRMVLLKDVDRGFVFYTNYSSRKARDIEANDHVSILFPWNVLERQVKVKGRAEKVSAAQSLRYFLSRPRDSQLAVWASSQSESIPTRQYLLSQLANMKQKFEGGEVPLPDYWGGYRVIPTEIEFWQGGAKRLHDRFLYSLKAGGHWDIRRLAP